MTAAADPGDRTSANRAAVQRAFEDMARGRGSVFDLLHPDVTWTIPGSGPSARTFRGKQDFLDHSATPLLQRLAEPPVPQLLGLWADADTVIVRWAQDTPARDGGRYRNSYAYFLTLDDGMVVTAVGFLDLVAYDELLARVNLEGTGSGV